MDVITYDATGRAICQTVHVEPMRLCRHFTARTNAKDLNAQSHFQST